MRIFRDAALMYVAIAISAAPSLAQEFNAKDYDINGNGRIDPGREAKVFFAHRDNAVLRKYDKNKNGKLDADEVATFNADVDEHLEILLIDMVGLDPQGRGVPVADVQRKFVPSEPKTINLPFLVRNAYTPFSITNPPTPAKSASGASVSYTHDNKTDNDVLTLKGAVIYPRQIELNVDYPGDRPGIRPTAVSFAPGIEFDRKWNRQNPKNQPNYLGFRSIGELELQGGIFESQYFRLSPFYKTDFDFESKIYGGEAEWQPIHSALALGAVRKIPGVPLQFSWQPVVRFEYERVEDAGQVRNLVSGSESTRGGAYLDANLWIIDGPFNRFSFHTQYWHLWGLNAESANRRYFLSEMLYRLDEAGYIALNATYRRGNPPGNGSFVDEFVAGLTIKH